MCHTAIPERIREPSKRIGTDIARPILIQNSNNEPRLLDKADGKTERECKTNCVTKEKMLNFRDIV